MPQRCSRRSLRSISRGCKRSGSQSTGTAMRWQPFGEAQVLTDGDDASDNKQDEDKEDNDNDPRRAAAHGCLRTCLSEHMIFVAPVYVQLLRP